MQQLKKLIRKKPNWHNLRSVEPISRVFGLDRGTPIDRYYIEDFLSKNKDLIKGAALEIAESTYSKKYGSHVDSFEVLHATDDNPAATIIGDLTDPATLPANKIDCFICTQTLNFIFDYDKAIQGTRHLLKEGGFVLATVSGISQISRYDMDRWGDYWRFTTLSMKKAFEKVYGENNVEVDYYGNVLSAIAFLTGVSGEELNEEELFFKDQDYQVTITVKAQKIA